MTPYGLKLRKNYETHYLRFSTEQKKLRNAPYRCDQQQRPAVPRCFVISRKRSKPCRERDTEAISQTSVYDIVVANHTQQHCETLPPTRCHTTTLLQHAQHRNTRPQSCDTGHSINESVSPYIALLQNSGKLRNEMYFRSSTCIFLFHNFVSFIYVVMKHLVNTRCDLQRCVSYFLRIFATPRSRHSLPSYRLWLRRGPLL